MPHGEHSATFVRKVRLGQISQNFCFFCWDARNFLRQLLDLADQIFLPHEVLVGVGWR